MKIGSFFLILLVALVALGYMLSDSLHLREDVAILQKHVEQLTDGLRRAEQEKQNVLIQLQNAGQELLSCQQTVERSNQIITQMADENTHLKEQNQLLASQQTSDNPSNAPQPEVKTFQAATFGLFTFLMLGVGSIVAIGLKSSQNHTRHSAQKGQYVHLTNAELKDLIQRRRESKESNTPYSSR